MSTLPHERVAEIHVRLGVVRLEADRLAIVLRRLLEAAESAVSDADVVMTFRNSAVQRNRPPDEIHGDVVASCLVREHAEIMQGVDMRRIERQHSLVGLLRLAQRARLVLLEGGGEKLGRRVGFHDWDSCRGLFNSTRLCPDFFTAANRLAAPDTRSTKLAFAIVRIAAGCENRRGENRIFAGVEPEFAFFLMSGPS